MQTVCEAHTHAKHAKSRGSGGMPPRKSHPLRLNLGAFLMIYDPLATLYYLITYSYLLA